MATPDRGWAKRRTQGLVRLAHERGLAILKKPQSGPILSVGARGGIIDHEYKRGEQELLEAIERHGEVTPARVALETSLKVAEADRMLSELAQGGHLKVRVEEGKLLYGL